MAEADKLATGVQGGFTAVAVTFLQEAVVAMIPWALVMFAVIVCDLCFALRRCWLMGEAVRLSKAVRATMGKTVTYFSFVLMVCMMETAAGGGLHLDRWACLVVCAVELSSIMSNILRPKGYSADFVKLLSKLLGGEDGVIVKDGANVPKKGKEGTQARANVPKKGKEGTQARANVPKKGKEGT